MNFCLGKSIMHMHANETNSTKSTQPLKNLQDIARYECNYELPRHNFKPIAIHTIVFRHFIHGLGQSIQQVLQTFLPTTKTQRNKEEQYLCLHNEMPGHPSYRMPCPSDKNPDPERIRLAPAAWRLRFPCPGFAI